MPQPPRPNIVHGAFLAIAMRWTDRLIGLVSTLILARLLTQTDFGVVATASLVIAFADVLLEMGVLMVLMQNKSPTPEHYHTAWTIRFIQTAIMTTLVLLGAPYAAEYFNNPALTPVIQVLALTFVFEGLENIWIINLQKNQQYARDFKFVFSKRFTGFLVTIVFAFISPSYWALVAGALSGRLMGVILSYVMHPGRPRPSLSKFKEIFAMSQWVWLRSITTYFQLRLHEIVVASREPSAVMGTYSLAGQIAAMPTSELLMPLNRVLFPAFVKVKDDLAELKRVFLLAQSVQALIGIPAGVGMALVAHEVVLLMLGEKWLSAVPFVEILAYIGCLISITTSGVYLLNTLGLFRIVALYSVIQVIMFACLAYLVFPTGGAYVVAQLRLLLAIIGIGIFVWLLCRELRGLKPQEMFVSVIRPTLGAIAMALAILWLERSVDWPLLGMLLAKIALGGSVYVITVLALWHFGGRQAGAESWLLEKFVYPRLKTR